MACSKFASEFSVGPGFQAALWVGFGNRVVRPYA